MFAYYAKWIKNFSDKAKPLFDVEKFPLNKTALSSFQILKDDLGEASLCSIREDVPFDVETDASNHCIAAILSQSGRPVAFMSRTLNACERNYPAIEKEATAIIEAIRKWGHFLKRRTFSLTTDQKSLSFMFDKRRHGKIKNNKILLWRLEMSQYHYEIRHRPGKDLVAPDTFSRVCATSFSDFHKKDHDRLISLHQSRGHPGFARLYHSLYE